MRRIIIGVLGFCFLVVSSVSAEIGNSATHFKAGIFGKDLGFRKEAQYQIKQGEYRGKTAYQFKAPKGNSSVELIVNSNGKIVSETILIEIGNALDAIAVCALVSEAADNKIPFELATNFIADSLRQGRKQSKKFGRYKVSVIPITALGIATITITQE